MASAVPNLTTRFCRASFKIHPGVSFSADAESAQVAGTPIPAGLFYVGGSDSGVFMMLTYTLGVVDGKPATDHVAGALFALAQNELISSVVMSEGEQE